MFAAPGHQHRAEKRHPHHDVDLDLVTAGDRGAEAVAPNYVREVEADGDDESEREDALDRLHQPVHGQILTMNPRRRAILAAGLALPAAAYAEHHGAHHSPLYEQLRQPGRIDKPDLAALQNVF